MGIENLPDVAQPTPGASKRKQAEAIAELITENWYKGHISFGDVHPDNCKMLTEKGYKVETGRNDFQMVFHSGPPTVVISWDPSKYSLGE